MLVPSLYRRAVPAGARISRWQAGDGWTLRRFDWAAPGQARGSLLFQGGRGDVIEKYLEAFAHWHGAGWNVTSFDWRGQGGSGRLSRDVHVGHGGDFGGLVGDLEAFWADWAATAPRPHALIGHSMGGHLVLRGMLERAVRPAAAVLVAPMLGLRSPLGARWGEALAYAVARLGDPARPAWKGERPAARATRQQMLTHDVDRYADEMWWQAADPTLRLGPPSWAWVAEAFTSTRRQRADPRIDSLAVPVLTLVAQADRLVDPQAAVAVAKRLPRGTLRLWGDEAAHEILREADPVRDAALAAIDAFLAQEATA